MLKISSYIILSMSLAGLPCITAFAQQPLSVVPNTLSKPVPTQLSAQAATVSATHFLSVCGLPPSRSRISTRLSVNSKGISIWEVRWDGDYEVDLDASTGQPTFFDNNRRFWEQIHGVGRDGQRFTSQKAATAELWRLARALGLPSEGYLARLDMLAENDPSIHDANKAGSIGANFSVKPNGYPFLGRGNGMSLVLDPVDGQLVFFTQSWDVVTAPAVLGLTRDEAVSRGFENFRLRHPELNGSQTLETPASVQAELGYVQPDQISSQDTFTAASPSQLKLAWVVYENGEKIYIDANDGTVIGGEQLKQGVKTNVLTRKGSLPLAEYLNPVPLHQAIQSVTAVSIYGQHIEGIHSTWSSKPLAILSDSSHADVFHSLKSTKHFGEFGVKTSPQYIFVFTLPNHPPQGYMYNGYLSNLNTLGESASVPDDFTIWLKQHPYLLPADTQK